MKNLKELETKLGVTFKDKKILENAFIHRSYLNETKDKSLTSNERLEFLGDAVLQFLSSKYIYATLIDFAEGDLTNLRSRIVNTESLAIEAKRLDIVGYLYISKGEREVAGSSSYILANLFEAVTGAIFLDQGLNKCEEFLNRNLFYKIADILKEGSLKDPKSQYQEYAQDTYNITPLYTLLSEEGPDHDKLFKMGVFIGDKQTGYGEGSSKRKAEQNAASDALSKI